MTNSVAKTVIRERRPEDVEQCVKVLRRVHERDGYPIVWPRDPVRWLSPERTAYAWVLTEEEVADAAAAEASARLSGVLGHILLLRAADGSAENSPEPRVYEVARLFVRPDARRLGLGTALLETAIAQAAQDGYSLTLEVVADESSTAISVYEKAGWRKVGTAVAEWKRPDGGSVKVHRYVR